MTKDEQIADQQKRIDQLSADNSLVRYFRAMTRQLDQMTETMNKITIDTEMMHSKDDKFFEKYKFFMKEGLPIAKNLKELEEMVAPIMKRQKLGGTAEQFAEFNQDGKE